MHRSAVLICGLLLVGLCGALSWLSQAFVYGEGHLDRPLLPMVGLLLTATVIYGYAVARILRQPCCVRVETILLIAMLCRAVLIPSNPMQEDDLYRYVWDGQVSLQGMSPYRDAPSAVNPALTQLVAEDPTGQRQQILDRVNNPNIPTIYPPVTQAIFALGQRVAPWSLIGLRTFLLLFDLLCILLLIGILKETQRPVTWVLIYAWSPLVIKEFANSGHMDSVAMAAVLLTIWLLLRRQWRGAAVSFALAIGSKYYPLLLLPVIGQWLWGAGRRVALGSVLAWSAALAACFWPVIADGTRVFAGLMAYGTTWQMNASLFALLQWILGGVVGPQAPAATRIVIAGCAGMILMGVMRWRATDRDPRTLTARCFMMLGALFLLSPVQNPWYLCWVVPLLCLHPSWPWLLLTGLMHLYYVGFFIEYHYPDQASTLWVALRWVEHLPFYLALLWQARWLSQRRVTTPC